MTDYLLELGKSSFARGLVRKAGLPVSVPVVLDRDSAAWRDPPLRRASVRCGGGSAVEEVLAQLGATVERDADRIGVLCFDSRGLRGPESARRAFEFLSGSLPALSRSGRVVVVADDVGPDPIGAAMAGALAGLVRSLARELGRKGSTAHLIRVAPGAEDRLAGPLAFVCSPKSAFVSGQVWRVGDEVMVEGDAPTWQRPLADRRAVVTGAARGIGAAIARALARDGARVLCVDLPGGGESRLRELAQDIGGDTLAIDVSAKDAPQRLSEAIGSTLDVLVHNAGITRDRTLARMSDREWDDVLGVNLGAVLRATESLSTGPLADGGRIVLMSSISGIGGNAGQCNYSAAKSGLIEYARALAPRVASRGITVNAVAPGLIDTPMTRAMPAIPRELARRANALSQAGEPGDVAELVSFLSMPQSLGISGQVIRCCGMNMLGQ